MMASIGKISSSLLTIPNELTVAAAALNFDFSLVKIEAPREFHGVRDALSKFRRNEAETGLPHHSQEARRPFRALGTANSKPSQGVWRMRVGHLVRPQDRSVPSLSIRLWHICHAGRS